MNLRRRIELLEAALAPGPEVREEIDPCVLSDPELQRLGAELHERFPLPAGLTGRALVVHLLGDPESARLHNALARRLAEIRTAGRLGVSP